MDSSFLSPAPLLTSVNGLRVGKRLGQDTAGTFNTNWLKQYFIPYQKNVRDRGDAHGYTIYFPKQDRACWNFFPIFLEVTDICLLMGKVNKFPLAFAFYTGLALSSPTSLLAFFLFSLLWKRAGEWVAVWVWGSCLSPTHYNKKIFTFWLPNVWKSL